MTVHYLVRVTQMVDWALAGLKALGVGLPTPLEKATAVGKHGGDRKSEAVRGEQGSNHNLDARPVGRGAAYTLARLDRDEPKLAEKVRAGELSANAAAIEAGFRKKPTPLDVITRARAWAVANITA